MGVPCILIGMMEVKPVDETSELVENVNRAANRAVRNSVDQEDLAQETLLRIWQRDGDHPDGLSVTRSRGLIRTILGRLRIDLWRREGRRLIPVDRTETDGPFEAVQRDEVRAMVREVMEQLPPMQREAVRMRFFEGMTFRAIAEMQGVPLNTALGRVHQAIKHMRRQLESTDEFNDE